jgi:4-amino-4-deoxy-L-arabinose transferase-like glycosyltransferase
MRRAQPFLTRASAYLQQIDRPVFAIAALAMASLAQASLTWSRPLVVGALTGIGALLLGTVVCRWRRGSLPCHRATSIAMLCLLVGTAVILKSLSSFRAAIPLYTIAAILFVLALRGKDEEAERASEPYSKTELLLLALIVALGFALQGYRVAEIPPGFHGDEAESGMQALSLLHGEVNSLISVGWYHLPMLSFAWHALSMRLLGETVYGLRMSSVIVGTLTLIPLYFLTRLLFGRRTALIATFLLAVSHPFIALNRLGINYTQTALFEVTTFYFLFRGLRSGRWWDFALSGVFMGAGLYLYYASRLVPFIVLAFWLCVALAAREVVRRHGRGMALSWLAALLVFSPMALYFLEHPWHLMSRTSYVFLFGTRGWIEAPYPRYDALTTLVNQAARVLPLFNYGGDLSGQYGYRGPMLDFITSMFFVLGLGYVSARAHRPRHFFLLIWFWATLIAGGVLTLPAPFLPRLVGLLPVLSIFAAVAIARLWTLCVDAWSHARVARATLNAIFVTALAGAALLNWDTYFNRYLPTVQGWAMREPATAIAQYINSLGDGYDVYLLGEPKLYVRHGTIRFIARDAHATDVLSSSQFIPLTTNPGRDAVYILLPTHLHHLQQIRQYYPTGVLREFTRESGELWFAAYEISAEDIASVR